jgi:ATP-binding cassette subfamily B protein
MESIRRLHHALTLVVIAHRLSTVRCCDQVCVIDAGRVVASGTYEELSLNSELFRSLAASGTLSAAG